MNTTNEPRKQGSEHPGPQCDCWRCSYRYRHHPGPRHPGPECGCYGCLNVRRQQGKAERRAGRGTNYGWGVALGIVWAIISAIVWAYTDSAANTCKNALVGALDQSRCTTVTFWHDMAGISVLLAILTIIFAGIAMPRRSN